MALLKTLLTVLLVIDSIFLMLLILIQLPKKEAGLGQAFGFAATDALFGAGSGTVLTRATKYAAGVFLGLALILSIMTSRLNPHRSRVTEFEQALPSTPQTQAVQPTAPKPAPEQDSILKATTTNLLISTQATNAPAGNKSGSKTN